MNNTENNWTVTAFMFSGRRNPLWKLSAAQAEEWLTKWNEAPVISPVPSPPGKLGYTGCRIEKDEHQYWMAGNGFVSYYKNGVCCNKEDKNRVMELYILSTAAADIKDILQIQQVL